MLVPIQYHCSLTLSIPGHPIWYLGTPSLPNENLKNLKTVLKSTGRRERVNTVLLLSANLVTA